MSAAPVIPPVITIVILAAGRSTRMKGANKLLAEIDSDDGGEPVIVRVVSAALASGAGPVMVVTGFEAEKVKKALGGLDVQLVDNPDYADGLSTSLRAGISALGEDASSDSGGALVLLGDMPRVSSDLIDALIERFHAEGGNVICRPVWGGRPGNPVLWPKDLFREMMAIEGDTGARGLLKRYAGRVRLLKTDDDAIHFDVDVPGDLDKS